jgi:uncharacterized protein (DUF302 family)
VEQTFLGWIPTGTTLIVIILAQWPDAGSRYIWEAMKSGDGIISKPSKFSVPETLDRLEALLRAKGITVFARIDHSGEAEKVGLKMPPTQVLIFGNPKGGTPLMLAAPTSAIDLPVKALAWQDSDGSVRLGYNDPQYLKRRFGVTDDDIKLIAVLSALIEQAAT